MSNSNLRIHTVIIGAGPLGLTFANLLKGKTDFKILLNIQYSSLIEESISPVLNMNPSKFWGNQHDTNIIENFMSTSSLSDLPGFPSGLEDKVYEYADKLSQLGWPNLTSKNSVNELRPFTRRTITRLNSNRILHKLSANVSGEFYYYNKLTLEKKVNNTYEIIVDGKKIYCDNLVFATGGVANFMSAKDVLKQFYPQLKKEHKLLGCGYANHPKAILTKVKFKKLVRFKQINFKNDLIYSWSRHYKEGLFTFRFLPVNENSGKISHVIDSIFIKLGYGHEFNVMMYCESPIIKANSLEISAQSHSSEEVLVNYKIPSALVAKAIDFQSQVIDALPRIAQIENIVKRNLQKSQLEKDQFHYIGTTRMGLDFTDSVVDVKSRMHGTTGIFFLGTSVLPIGRFEHPTYASMLLSVEVANYIGSFQVSSHE